MYEIAKIQSQIEAKLEKEVLEPVRANDEMIETCIWVLVLKHRSDLNQNVKDTRLAHGWKEWSVQAAELQYFWIDAENQKKEGHRFYKMDESSIQVLQEDLTAFQALASTHTTTIRNLLEEFNNDQLLLMLEIERALKEAT